MKRYNQQYYLNAKAKKIAELGEEGWAAFQREKNLKSVAARKQLLGAEGYRQYERDRAQRRRYGVTQRELGDCCASCGAKDGLHVDHDHATGKVRGVLCFNCNVILGHARDNPGVLRNLIAYLEKS